MRVLVCDDEPIIRKLVELSLRGTGHDLRTVGSGAEALETMRDWAPDVLLTDVAMPEMDGLDLATSARSDPRLQDLPIVFMTATVHVEHIAERTVGGPTAYLYKPFGPAALRELLDSLATTLPAGRAASPSRGGR
jgi:CheY-like chemotaxis protein